MGIFKEYLNSKGKVETGTVCISGDRTDPMTPPNKPPKGHSSQKAYSNGGKKSKKGSEKGFGDMGDQDTKYDPCCNDNKGKAPAKIPTAEQAFAELELVPLITEAVEGNPTILEKIVYDLKRNGKLGALVAEVMSHRETYQHIAELMSNETYGPEICKKMTRAMNQLNEEVDTPFHKAAELEDDDAADMDDMENQDGQDDAGLDDELDDLGDENMGDMDMGDEDMSMDAGDGDFGADNLTNSDAAMGNDMSGDEPVDPLMQMRPEMAQFQKAFQRSFQKHFQRKMMGEM